MPPVRAQSLAPPATAPPLTEVVSRLRDAVAGSVADATEAVWLEVLRGRAATAEPDDPPPRWRRLVQVRVEAAGRLGFHRGEAGDPAALASAVRLALGQSRLAAPGASLDLPGPEEAARAPEVPLHDAAVAELTPGSARELLAAGEGAGERLGLDWSALRLVVANSQGLVASTEATALTLAARHGDGPGAGWAAASARSLAALAAPRVLERARARAADGSPAAAPPATAALLLSPEAAAALVALLNRTALAARPFADGSSYLAGAVGRDVFSPLFGLVDDGGDAAGLPLPFDLSGHAKRRVEMVRAGRLLTPAVDAALAASLGLAATPHDVGGDETRAAHLFVAPGGASDEALAEAVAGGLWIGELRGLHPHDLVPGRFRGIARNVRRLAADGPGAPVGDLLWEADLREVFSHLVAVGEAPVVFAAGGAPWGAVSSPALAIAPCGRLLPAGPAPQGDAAAAAAGGAPSGRHSRS